MGCSIGVPATGGVKHLITLFEHIVIVCMAVGVLWLITGPFFVAYLSIFPPRTRPRKTPKSFGAGFDEISFRSRDGMELKGWLVPSQARSRGVIIMCHGMLANRGEGINWAQPLWRAGFTLVMFDFRRLGASKGDMCTAGDREPQDLLGAVDWVSQRSDLDGLPVGVFGFSMGGASAIMAGADDPRIEAVAAHGAFATLGRAILQRCHCFFGWFAPLNARVARAIGHCWLPIDPDNISPLAVIERLAPRPVMLIHGDRDPIVSPGDAHALFEAAGQPKQLRILPRSMHNYINAKCRGEVQGALVDFFVQNLRKHDLQNPEREQAVLTSAI